MSSTIARPRWPRVVLSARLWCGLAMLGLVAPAFYLLGDHYRAHLATEEARDHLFGREGVAAQAEVTSKSELPYAKGVKAWSVSYTYRAADGRLCVGLGHVARETWEGLRKGDQLPIVYLRDKPDTSRPIAEVGYRAPGIITTLEPILIAACAVIGLILIGSALRGAREPPCCPHCGGRGTVRLALANNQGTMDSPCNACWDTGESEKGS